AEARDNRPATGADVARLGTEETGRLDVPLQLTQAGRGEVMYRREALEEGRRDEVDTLVGTLRRQDGGDQELQRRLVLQRARRVRIELREDPRGLAGPILRGERLSHEGMVGTWPGECNWLSSPLATC